MMHISDKLQYSDKHKLILEHRITQIKSAAKDHVEEITKHFIKQSSEESKKHQKIKMGQFSTLLRVSALYNKFKSLRFN
jgi:hypothetical protein